MVRRCRDETGMTAIEVIVALAIFIVLLLILASLQLQFLAFERETDLELFDHPQKLAVLERVRRDVQDSVAYPSTYQKWVQSPSTLILRHSANEVVVWSFGSKTAERQAWTNDSFTRRWTAHGVPEFEVGASHGAPGKIGVRLKAFDDDERLIFDQIIIPRSR